MMSTRRAQLGLRRGLPRPSAITDHPEFLLAPARAGQGLDLAEQEATQITARRVDDVDTNDFLTRLRFEEHLAGYQPTEITWMVYNPKTAPRPRGSCSTRRGAPAPGAFRQPEQPG